MKPLERIGNLLYTGSCQTIVRGRVLTSRKFYAILLTQPNTRRFVTHPAVSCYRLATLADDPPDLRLSTPSTPLPVPPLLTVTKTHPAIARANRAGCVQCAYVTGV
jgi:hypothetical protein